MMRSHVLWNGAQARMRRRNAMDMSVVFLVAMGFLTSVAVAGLFQTVSFVATRRRIWR